MTFLFTNSTTFKLYELYKLSNSKTMKPTTIILAFLVISMSAFSQSAEQISTKSNDLISLSSMEMTSTLKIYDPRGNVRERQLTTNSGKFGDVAKVLVKFTAPADVKGTALLIYDYDDKADNMWIYMPALRKVRRVVSNERGKSFMGSEFSNADMSKPSASDFNYALLGSEKFENNDCWKTESTCKTKEIQTEQGFSRKISWIDKSNYLCYKIEFYDQANKLQRIELLSNYKKLSNGKYFAYLMTMENVQTKRKSEIITNSLKTDSKLSENIFSPALLNK